MSDTALGHGTVISTEHDDATRETWMVLDCDAIDEAVAAHLEAETRADAANKTRAMFGGGEPWYGTQRKTKRKPSKPSASDNKRVRKYGAKENMKVRDSAHSAMKGTGKKKRKATRIQSSSDEADDR